MESNTFTTTIYAQTPAARAFDYLRRLQNLDEWTLGSRMITRIDDDTFMGTASGYQTMLCYHVQHARTSALRAPSSGSAATGIASTSSSTRCSCFPRSTLTRTAAKTAATSTGSA